jgi:hypothetical protein
MHEQLALRRGMVSDWLPAHYFGIWETQCSRVARSSFRNAVSISSAWTTKRFRRNQSRTFANSSMMFQYGRTVFQLVVCILELSRSERNLRDASRVLEFYKHESDACIMPPRGRRGIEASQRGLLCQSNTVASNSGRFPADDFQQDSSR